MIDLDHAMNLCERIHCALALDEAGYGFTPDASDVAELLGEYEKLVRAGSTPPAASPSTGEDVREACALLCDRHAEWAERKIQDGDDPGSSTSQMWACMSNTANDLAEMIRKDLPPMSLASTGEDARAKEILAAELRGSTAEFLGWLSGLTPPSDKESIPPEMRGAFEKMVERLTDAAKRYASTLAAPPATKTPGDVGPVVTSANQGGGK